MLLPSAPEKTKPAKLADIGKPALTGEERRLTHEKIAG